MRCRAARAASAAAVERELALETRLALDAHLAGCAACAEFERRQRRLQELLEGPGDPAPVRADVESAVRVVFARLERGEGAPLRVPPPRGTRRTYLPRAGAGLAAAALVVFLLTRGAGSRGPSPTETPLPAPPPAAPLAQGEVETAVRAALLASFADLAPDDAPGRAAARARFDERLREPARAGWPVRRFVTELVASPDVRLARAAVACLETLRDPASLAALERALQRPELSSAAFVALSGLGEPACTVLERALGEPELAPGALAALCRIGGERVVAILERAARAARPHSAPSRAALLDALTSAGPSAVASLLRLAGETRARAEQEELLARLPLVAGAGPALVAELERGRVPPELHYRALLLLQPFEALPWLAERCASHRERAAALEVLVGYPGTPPLETLLALAEHDRAPRAELVGALVGLLERDALRAPEVSRALAARGGRESLRAWLLLLVESAHPGAAAALVPLALSAALPEEERQWAALAAGELGGAEEARALLDGLARAPRPERRTLAACLIAVHAGLGAEGVAEFLGPCSPAQLRRVTDSLESGERGGAAVRLHRVARALDDALLESALLARKQP